MAEVYVTKKKRIFCRRSHPDVFCKKGALKYLVKLIEKHVYRSLFQKKFQAADVDLQLYLKRASCKGFLLWYFSNSSEQLFYSIVDTWIAASDLTECLETLTINEHLRKTLKILTIAVDFTENIWNFGVALKLSENRI